MKSKNIDSEIRREFSLLQKNHPKVKHDWMANYRSFSKQCESKARAEAASTLEPWISLLEICIQWLAHLHIALFEGSIKYSKKYRHKIFVPCVLTGTACVQARSILTLVSCGFDSPARSILRTLIETLSICIVTAHNDELCRKYYKSRNFKKSNELWYREFSRGKLQNLLHQVELTSGFPNDVSNAMRKWFKEESSVYSQTIHTSYISAFLTAFPIDKYNNYEPRKGVFGCNTGFSHRTLSQATMFIWYFSRIGYNSILDTTKYKGELVKSLTGKNKNGAAVVFGREVLSKLTLKYWSA